jgi:hypothetical protein
MVYARPVRRLRAAVIRPVTWCMNPGCMKTRLRSFSLFVVYSHDIDFILTEWGIRRGLGLWHNVCPLGHQRPSRIDDLTDQFDSLYSMNRL